MTTMTTMTKADWAAVARAEAEFMGLDGDWDWDEEHTMTTMTLDDARRLNRASRDADAAHLTAYDRFYETRTDADYAALCDAETAKAQAEREAGAADTTIRRLQAVTCICGLVWARGSTVSPCGECS